MWDFLINLIKKDKNMIKRKCEKRLMKKSLVFIITLTFNMPCRYVALSISEWYIIDYMPYNKRRCARWSSTKVWGNEIARGSFLSFATYLRLLVERLHDHEETLRHPIYHTPTRLVMSCLTSEIRRCLNSVQCSRRDTLVPRTNFE